jgi:hypothetical protein
MFAHFRNVCSFVLPSTKQRKEINMRNQKEERMKPSEIPTTIAHICGCSPLYVRLVLQGKRAGESDMAKMILRAYDEIMHRENIINNIRELVTKN